MNGALSVWKIFITLKIFAHDKILASLTQKTQLK